MTKTQTAVHKEQGPRPGNQSNFDGNDFGLLGLGREHFVRDVKVSKKCPFCFPTAGP